jgi:hypothetical protein
VRGIHRRILSRIQHNHYEIRTAFHISAPRRHFLLFVAKSDKYDGDQSSAADSSAWTVVARDQNSQTWQRTVNEIGPLGQVFLRVHSYVELRTCMNVLSNGQWIAANDQIASTATGAQATNSAVTVSWLGNINSAGVVTIHTPDGKSLSTSILGLCYTDTNSGQSVMFAELQEGSTGQILPTGTQAIYQQAFSNLNADVFFEYSRSSLEQFVIFHEQPPSPSVFGLNPTTTMLECWTGKLYQLQV